MCASPYRAHGHVGQLCTYDGEERYARQCTHRGYARVVCIFVRSLVRIVFLKLQYREYANGIIKVRARVNIKMLLAIIKGEKFTIAAGESEKARMTMFFVPAAT